MGKNVRTRHLNFGCGGRIFESDDKEEWINVDAYGNPDIRWDLNITPYPFDDCFFDGIFSSHVFEHLDNRYWWNAFKECARILKVDGILDMRVPDESSSTALTYRDHNRVFALASFHGVKHARQGLNAWAESEFESVPFELIEYHRVPFAKYQWMVTWCPWLLEFCAGHMRNFIHEQQFIFRKIAL